MGGSIVSRLFAYLFLYILHKYYIANLGSIFAGDVVK